jgi:Uri superfamily endonuclease
LYTHIPESVTDGIWLGKDRISTLPGKSRGSYVLLVRLSDERVITVGNLGDIRFATGFYAYVGSAMNGLKARLSRHLAENKKRHWHIDYLLERASVIDIALHETGSRSECAVAGALGIKYSSVPGFGCSDCRCRSHLFFALMERDLREGIESAILSLKPS